MDSENETKSTSLSSLDHIELPKSKCVTTRNALSTVKRSKGNMKVSFKTLRLKDLTQEMLDAQNEPLGEITDTETEENAETNSNTQKIAESISLPLPNNQEENSKNFMKNNYDLKDLDLGVSWLETPSKHNIIAKPTSIADLTLIIKRNNRLLTSSGSSKKGFVTPTSSKQHRDGKSASSLKIQCTIDAKQLLKTPLNNLVNKHNERTPQNSRQKQLKFGSAVKSVDRCNSKVTFLSVKSNIKNSNSVLQQKNKENVKIKNAKPKVQFSTHLIEKDDVKELTIKSVKYVVLNELGRGGSSTVYHCYDPNAKSERAIKKVKLSNDTNAVGYINEVKLLDKLQKCNKVIKMFDYEIIESEHVLLVVLEKGGSDLSKILKELSSPNKHLPMYMLIFYWMEMLYAVKQIHDNGIVHSDLKPGNFLRVEDGLKIIDFGIASSLQSDMTSVVRNIPIGSFNYISPEALTNQSSSNCNSPSFGKPRYKVNYKSDVWSLGCILYQLVYRKTPFQHISHMWVKLSAIMDPEYKIDYPQVDWVPLRIVNTIKSCLQYNTKDRPSVDDLIKEYEAIYS